MIAYVILAHTDLKMLNILIDKLCVSNCDIYIHLDKKTLIKISEVHLYKNVKIVSNRISVKWGGFSVVQATLNCIREVLDSQKNYNKVVLLSGQDYPVKKIEYINNYFKNEFNYIRGFNISLPITQEINRYVDHLFLNDANPILKKIMIFLSKYKVFRSSRTIKLESGDWDIYQGSQWWALNIEVLRSLMKFLKTEEGSLYIKKMRKLHAPDENFFATFFFHSKYWNSNKNNGPEEFPFVEMHKFMGTSIEGTAATAYFYNFHIIHNSLVKIYDELDYAYIKDRISSPDILFIRKVVSNRSGKLLKLIELNK
ncbi:beta-1,6-N-acetylglucosaminyltransferase [Loigolactobacillus coryniformis]|uniref:Peptide O-xylosyltransferase n=1 Tax=Loigolactobacillus coryniformis TaxID=1610 RepID=A0A5B8TE04_9LACO|nr:beta-1,6-N-acetylglucosaminyltransferase [Loigolactobacillus coryniformis]QEA52667.1 beta-1,6-N-acetylglucosaminyltransferase [Loigolactobacillus coryniformis]